MWPGGLALGGSLQGETPIDCIKQEAPAQGRAEALQENLASSSLTHWILGQVEGGKIDPPQDSRVAPQGRRKHLFWHAGQPDWPLWLFGGGLVGILSTLLGRVKSLAKRATELLRSSSNQVGHRELERLGGPSSSTQEPEWLANPRRKATVTATRFR